MHSPRTRVTALSFSLLSGLGACQNGGSGGGAPPPPAEVSAASVGATVPAEGATGVPVGSAIQATFTEAMEPASLGASTFTLSALETPSSIQVGGAVGYDPATRTATFTPDGPLASKTSYEARLGEGITDLSGKPLSGPFSWTFTTADVLPPAIVAVSPACGTVNIAPEAVLCATFSEPLDGSALQPANFVLQKIPSQILVAGSLELNAPGTELCFVPAADLETDAIYKLTIAGIQDESGLPLAQSLQCEFASLETVKPFVVSTYPAPGAEDLLTNIVPTATLSEPLDPTTIGPAALQLADEAGQPVDGAVSYDPQTFTFALQPAKKLKTSTTFTATLDSTIQDVAGNPMAAPYIWSFSTFKGWNPPELLESDGAVASEPIAATDPTTGITYAAWEQMQAGDAVTNIYVNRFVPGTGWTGAVRASDNVGNASAPRVAVDGGDGTPHLVWIERSTGDSNPNVYASFLPGGTGTWSAQLRVSDDLGSASAARVAVDSVSHIPYACWIEKGSTDNKNNVYANFYAGVPPAWASQARLSDDVGPASAPVIDADPLTGTVYVGWIEKSTGDATNNLYATSLTASTLPWQPQVKVSSGSAAPSAAPSAPAIAVNPKNGNAFLAWIQKGAVDANTNVYSSLRPGPADPWGTQQRASDDSAACSAPRISLDSGTGTLHAAWIQKAPTDLFNNVYANRYPNAAGPWLAQARVSPDSAAASSPEIAADPDSGMAFAVWIMKGPGDVNNNLYSSLLLPETSVWDVPFRVSTDDAPAEKPQVRAFTAEGLQDALSLWRQKKQPGAVESVMAALLQL